MLTKAQIDAAETAFLEWQEKSSRYGPGMNGYSPDRFPFHAGCYAAIAACGRSKAPPGWWCTRIVGHDGPCAAVDLGGER